MSQQLLEEIVGRAILDREFRFALFADPATALAEYQLSDEELIALKWLDAESLDAWDDNVGGQMLREILASARRVANREAADR